MNHSSPGLHKPKLSLSVSKSIDGFLKFKTAEGLSPKTIASYHYALEKWLNYIGDRNILDVETSDITGYLAWLRTEYKPIRFNGSKKPLSGKKIL